MRKRKKKIKKKNNKINLSTGYDFIINSLN